MYAASGVDAKAGLKSRPASSASVREICASRLAIWEVAAPTSAAAKVGSSVANNCPRLTRSPSCTSRLLMIEASSACNTIAGSVVTTWPAEDVTTRLMCITILTPSKARNNPASTYSVSRSCAGSGSSRTSSTSERKIRTNSSGSGLRRGAGAKRKKPMGLSVLEMVILLMPEPAIDVAALQQLVVWTGVVEPAALKHQHGVGLHEHREAVRNDHERAAFGDPQ